MPCYNEADVLHSTIGALTEKIEALCAAGMCSEDSYLVLVDDGSIDDTWEIIRQAVFGRNGRVVGLSLAINAGHQNAVIAGLDYTTGKSDLAITIDADLQDDLNCLGPMIEEYKKGFELVLGIRKRRSSDTWFKRVTASYFYKGMRALGVDVVDQHADFRLMSSAALHNLKLFPEYHLFLRGLVTRLHSRVAFTYYDRLPRMAGETKYPLRRMLSLAWRGVTSFSIVPLRIISILGFCVFSVSFLMVLLSVIAWATGHAVPGWASTTVPLYTLGGIQMLSLGVVGEYIGKLFEQSKNRPRYIIDRIESGNE